MNRKYKLGERVRILWDMTLYDTTPNYKDTGRVRGYFQTPDGRMLVELYDFHKASAYHGLHFPMSAVRPLKGVVKDGDAL